VGEDGLAGISDDKQRLCFALALWNGKDPSSKSVSSAHQQRGQPREDVKEYYFYLDSTPTHSYMKYLYKYPHAAFPYEDLVRTNGQRTRDEMEYELLDTGVFNDNRYFDVFVEYAKAGPEDILVRITAANRDRTRRNCISCRHSGSGTTGRRGLPNPAGLPRNPASADRGSGGHERRRGNASAAG